MDEFKKYLKLHETELNTERPGASVWEQVKLKTGKRPSVVFPINNWLKYAAAVVLLLMIGFAIKYTTSGTKNQQLPPIARQTDSLPGQQTDTAAVAPENIIREEKVREPQERKSVQASPKRKNRQQEVMNELENNYGQLVSYQLERIRRTPVYAEGPGYFDSFKTQFYQVEKDEAAVKRDIAKNGLNDILLDQLIEVYQQKLNVLKSFQTAIRKMNNRVQLAQTDSAAAKHYYITL